MDHKMTCDMFDVVPLETILRSPDRVYHGLGHIKDLLALIDKADVSRLDKEILDAVAWFHDIYYDVKLGSPGNEEKSIEFFQSYPHGFNTENAKRIESVIRATGEHTQNKTYKDPLINTFLDFDMHSFARPYDIFCGYSAQVRDEYIQAGYPPEMVALGQKSFLEGLLSKEKIYRTATCHDWEERARTNIARRLSEEEVSLPKKSVGP